MPNPLNAILRRAREIIADPARWTKGLLARDRTNHEVDLDHPSACKFCILGAVARAKIDLGYLGNNQVDPIRILWEVCSEVQVTGSVHVFNDAPETKHEDVLRLLDAAIVVTAP